MPANGKFEVLAELLGPDGAAALCETMGGRTVHVPRPGASCEGFGALADTLGAAGAIALCERYSGEAVYVPMARKHVAPLLHAQGASAREIAQRLRTSAPTVRAILRRANR